MDHAITPMLQRDSGAWVLAIVFPFNDSTTLRQRKIEGQTPSLLGVNHRPPKRSNPVDKTGVDVVFLVDIMELYWIGIVLLLA